MKALFFGRTLLIQTPKCLSETFSLFIWTVSFFFSNVCVCLAITEKIGPYLVNSTCHLLRTFVYSLNTFCVSKQRFFSIYPEERQTIVPYSSHALKWWEAERCPAPAVTHTCLRYGSGRYRSSWCCSTAAEDPSLLKAPSCDSATCQRPSTEGSELWPYVQYRERKGCVLDVF